MQQSHQRCGGSTGEHIERLGAQSGGRGYGTHPGSPVVAAQVLPAMLDLDLPDQYLNAWLRGRHGTRVTLCQADESRMWRISTFTDACQPDITGHVHNNGALIHRPAPKANVAIRNWSNGR